MIDQKGARNSLPRIRSRGHACMHVAFFLLIHQVKRSERRVNTSRISCKKDRRIKTQQTDRYTGHIAERRPSVPPLSPSGRISPLYSADQVHVSASFFSAHRAIQPRSRSPALFFQVALRVCLFLCLDRSSWAKRSKTSASLFPHAISVFPVLPFSCTPSFNIPFILAPLRFSLLLLLCLCELNVVIEVSGVVDVQDHCSDLPMTLCGALCVSLEEERGRHVVENEEGRAVKQIVSVLGARDGS
mmetsp:Transcript_46006/g.90639  ORF Transcript_46006/g.90639 Transcript_46006/m.90639 type:complete len:244 (-) Transcript_46006:12-743(-)